MSAPDWRSVLTVSPTVWRLGFTSLLTDISSEMVGSILPLYFVLYLHFSPLEFGFLDGISQGAAVALLSLFSGVMADRWRRPKEVASAGYALSAFSKIGLLAAGGLWGWITTVLVLDRVGKGIRTAPRDAMISFASARGQLATAFAVHRGLDTGGAIFGPLAGFLLLRSLPGAVDLILVASFFIALVGLGVITLLVDKPVLDTTKPESSRPSLRLSFGLLNQPRFRFLVMAAGLLALATASDSFVYLLLQSKAKSSATSIPLYAFFTAVFYLLLSVPAGRVADQWGRRKVFLIGYAFLAMIYAILLAPEIGAPAQFVVVSLLGAYYAATDGVLAAMTSATLSTEWRSSGLALLNTATSLARLVSSVLFGWLWSAASMKSAVWTFLLVLAAAMISSAWILRRRSTL